MANGSDVNATLPETTVTAKRDPATPASAPTPPASALWMRMWDVVIAGGPNASHPKEMNTQSLAQFHMTFDIDLHCTTQGMQKAMVTVWNPPPELITDNLAQWSDIAIYGGYQKARYGELFSGKITYFRHGKRSTLETFLEINAASNDELFTQAFVNHALPAGSTGNDVINAVLAVMAPFGVSKGQITALAGQMPASPRGRTLFGMPLDILRDLGQTLDARVFVDSGQLHVLGPGEQISGDEIELNTGNGLVNFPSQEMDGGLKLECLLHYQVRPGRVIKINNKDYNTKVSQITKGQSSGMLADLGLEVSQDAIQADGKYGVFRVRHHGDNRGQPWYSEITTNPIIQPSPTLGTGT
jgi:hypothetical protein